MEEGAVRASQEAQDRMVSNLVKPDFNDTEVCKYCYSNKIQQQVSKYHKIPVRYTHDGGWIAPTPGVVRGVKEAVRLLKLRGHEVVEFKPPQLEKGYR